MPASRAAGPAPDVDVRKNGATARFPAYLESFMVGHAEEAAPRGHAQAVDKGYFVLGVDHEFLIIDEEGDARLEEFSSIPGSVNGIDLLIMAAAE